MAKVYTYGRMDENMLANTKMISNMGKVSSLGPMVGPTMESGTLVSNMEKESILQMALGKKATGRWVKRSTSEMKWIQI